MFSGLFPVKINFERVNSIKYLVGRSACAEQRRKLRMRICHLRDTIRILNLNSRLGWKQRWVKPHNWKIWLIKKSSPNLTIALYFIKKDLSHMCEIWGFKAVRNLMFRVSAPCRLVTKFQRFGEIYCVHFQSWIWCISIPVYGQIDRPIDLSTDM